VLFESWVNILLVAVPVGFILNYVRPAHGGMAVFFVNFVAIIPLAAMLSNATEELARRVGEVRGALLNVTFGWVWPYGLASAVTRGALMVR
jgi:Ca2+:H+ antiporter